MLSRNQKIERILLLEELDRRAGIKFSMEERARTRRNADAIKERCHSLTGFIREAWHTIEPSIQYVHGWHIDALCEHLEAVSHGSITRLLINIPPGMMKSLTVAVFWPAWEWGPCGQTSLRYLTTSYSEHYAKRDARRMRDLIESDWYQELWGDTVKLVRAGEKSFSNTGSGWREAMPFTSLTSGRGDRVIIDDPHSTEKAESEKDRRKIARLFRESLPTRLNVPEESAIVIIMQRLHEEDMSGLIIDGDYGYDHLMLPMEYDPKRQCKTSIGFEDPRTEDGELLFEDRFPRWVVDRDTKVLGAYASAGQYQQRPSPRGGGMFQRKDFEIISAAPAGCQWCRGWDLAGSDELTSAFTAGILMGKTRDGQYIIQDMTRIQGTALKVNNLLKNTATQDDAEFHAVLGSIPQDPGSAGKDRADELIRILAGHNYRKSTETGDKRTRAESMSAQAEAKNIKLVKGDWNKDFLDEITVFPAGKFKDQVDAASRAFNELSGKKRRRVAIMPPETIPMNR